MDVETSQVSEAVRLKVSDVDSERCRIFVCGGKGQKDLNASDAAETLSDESD